MPITLASLRSATATPLTHPDCNLRESSGCDR